MSELATLAADVIVPPGLCCGITAAGRAATCVSMRPPGDRRAAQVDEVQYGANEGPCLEALNTGAVMTSRTCSQRHAGRGTARTRCSTASASPCRSRSPSARPHWAQ